METTKEMYKRVDELTPLKREHLAILELTLCQSPSLSRTSDELLAALSEAHNSNHKFDRSYLQKLLAELNEIYGFIKGDKSSGLNHISRGPVHKLRNTDYLAFPEQVLRASDREHIHRILRIASLFDGAIPLNKLLRKSNIRNIDSLLEDATQHAEIDTDGRMTALIESIYEGIENKRVLKFRYPPLDKCHDIRVSPYYIKRFNNKWFLLGNVRDQPYTWSVIALSRIVGDISIDTESLILYKPLKDIKVITDYYKNVIGFEVVYDRPEDAPTDMSPYNLNVLHIEIRCHNEKVFRRIKENPLHTTQGIIEDRLIVTLDVIENNILYNKLLSFGPEIEVITPAQIRDGMAKRLKTAHELYQNGQ